MRRLHPMMIDEIMHVSAEPGDPVAILMAASLIREDFPWLYELSMEVYRAAKSGNIEDMEQEIRRLRRVSEFALRGPMREELGLESDEGHVLALEFPRILERGLMRAMELRNAQLRPRRSKAGAEGG
jgi:hypothetical protein